MPEIVGFSIEAGLSAPSVGRARLRSAVESVLSGCNEDDVDRVSYDMELIASELLTNAVRAGARRIDLRLEDRPGHLRLTVADDAPGAPIQRSAGRRDVNGRGLTIVSAVAASWGVDRASSSGKAVWADVRTPAPTASGRPGSGRNA